MDQVIAAGVLAIAALVGAILIITTIGPSAMNFRDSTRQSNITEIGLITNKITIVKAEVLNNACASVWVKNNGSTPLRFINHWDLFLSRADQRTDVQRPGINNRHHLPYAKSESLTVPTCRFNTAIPIVDPCGDCWSQTPGITTLPTEETIEIHIQFGGTSLDSGDYMLTVMTSEGVTGSKLFRHIRVPTPAPTLTPAPIQNVVFVSKWGTNGPGDGQFWGPRGVAVASDGSVYVADSDNHRIQKFTSEGVFVSKWGTRGSGDGQFERAYGVAAASDGSVYVADFGNDRIQKFTSEGVFVSKWGTNGTGDGKFRSPCGVAAASDGSVYVTDRGNHRIQKFTATGVFVSKFGTYGAGDGQFLWPRGVAAASDGSVYVADLTNHRIQKFSPGP